MNTVASMRNPPVVLLICIASFLAVPVTYTLDRMILMQNHLYVFTSGLIILPLFGFLSYLIVKRSPGKNEVLFYVWSIFSFTAIVDLLIALELDGYVKGFMEFYLREGEPYLRSSYGTMINYWDGTGHFLMYLLLIGLLCARKNYRIVGLYWVGSIMQSMIVYMPGNITGNKGIRWSYLLNVPYMVFPVYAGIRFLKEGLNIKYKKPKAPQSWEKIADWVFIAGFIAACTISAFRFVACMGCKDAIAKYYVTEIEPYLDDPFQYGRTQALCYFYYFTPYFIGAILSLLYPGQTWVKDWSVLMAGAAVQAQFSYICSALKWRTDESYRIPSTDIARTAFWIVNLGLLILPHLFALYINRLEVEEVWTENVLPAVKSCTGETTGSKKMTQQNDRINHEGPVTRQQKKKM